MTKEMIQLDFWNECRESRCGFCSLIYTRDKGFGVDPNVIISPEDKIKILDILIKFVPTIDWDVFDKISFQGGEIMNGLDPACIPTYTDFLEKLVTFMLEDKLVRIYLITSLKYQFEGSLLEYTLDLFRSYALTNKVMIGTSYDIKYRFTPENEKIWWQNLGKVKRAGASIHCTTVMSQFFIDAYKARDKKLMRLMKVFPDTGLDLIGAIGDRYYEYQPEDFLPKRKDLISFCLYLMKNRYSLWRRFADQSGRRATHIYRTLHDSIIWRDLKNHTGDELDIIGPCGHYILCRSYADSDECYACDIKALMDMEQGMLE